MTNTIARKCATLRYLVVCCVALSGCAGNTPVVRNEPGTTFGDIYVGYPRIAGRERLVNDRLDQERWLTEQLNKVNENDLGFDGVVDIRNILYSSAQLKAQVDPAYKLYAEQQAQAVQGVRTNAAIDDAVQQARLAAVQQITTKLTKGELTVDQANSELDKLGITRAAVAAGAAASAPEFPKIGAATPALSSSMPGIGLLDANSSGTYVPPSGGSANSTSLQGSPIDRFRDLVAIREEIRTARIENALDDAHDIKGNTLYRMTFDVTVRPRPDTSALAIVEMTAEPVPDNPEDLVQKIRRAFEIESRSRVESQWKEIKQRLETECLQISIFSAAIECGIVDLSTRDQGYIWKALNQNAIWLHRLVQRQESTNGITLTSSQLIKQLLVDTEAIRLDDSPASCYFEVIGTSAGSVIDPEVPNQSARTTFDIFQVRTDVAIRLVSSAAPVDKAAEELRSKRLARYGCKNFSGAKGLTSAINGWLLPKSGIKSYAVTPRETVQRLSELGGNRTAREFLLGLSAVTPGGGMSAAYQQLRANDALYQSIRRQPIVVGVSDLSNNASGSTSVGWILGPQFQLSDNGATVRFRHSPKQQSVSATLSIPAWLGQMDLCIRTYWLTEGGRKIAANGTDSAVTNGAGCSDVVRVSLPQKPSTLVAQSFEDVLQREPTTSVRQRLDLKEGEPAKILITGTDLWRSTEVYVGAQKADKVSLTPDMQGVQAVFNRVESPTGSRLKDGRVELIVFTSEGRVQAGTVSIARASEQATVSTTGFSRRLVADQSQSFDLSARLGSYSSVEVRIQDPQNTAMDVKVPDVRVAQDERRITFSVSASALPGVRTGQLLNVVFRLKRMPDSSPIDVIVARNVVYFASAADAKVVATLVGSPTTLPLSVNMSFHAAVINGFGGMASKRIAVTATAALVSGKKLLLDGLCEFVNNSCKVNITGSPSVLKEITDEKRPWKLNLGLVGEDIPELVEADFDIPR